MHPPSLRLLAAATLLLSVQLAGGEAPSEAANLPQQVLRGLSAFKANGGKVAVENWARGGPLENTDIERSEAAAIEKLEDLYGRYQGYSVVAQTQLTPASRFIYLEIQLEKGPVYFKFHVYTGKLGAHVVAIDLDPVPERILPPYVLETKADSSS